MATFERVVTVIARGAGLLGGLAIVAMMLNIVTDATMRSFFSQPLEGTLEYVQYWWMITIAFAAWGMAHLKNDHIEAPLLYDRMPAPIRHLWLLIADGVALLFMGVLVYHGWSAARDAHRLGEFAGAAGTPIWPTRYWIPIAATIFALLVAARVITALRTGRHPAQDDNADDTTAL